MRVLRRILWILVDIGLAALGMRWEKLYGPDWRWMAFIFAGGFGVAMEVMGFFLDLLQVQLAELRTRLEQMRDE